MNTDPKPLAKPDPLAESSGEGGGNPLVPVYWLVGSLIIVTVLTVIGQRS
jgi:hypothetical protein